MLPEAAADHYRQQQRLTVATLGLVRTLWRDMGPDFDPSWSKVLPRMLLVAQSAQLGAARTSEPYVDTVLAELGTPAPAVAEVVPEAFVGAAGDGRDLDTLLYGAVTTAKDAVRRGGTPAQGLSQGGRWLDMAVQTLIADTSRAAVSVGIAARPKVTGYVRMLNTPSCSRCVILAGKWFRWNTGFLRHPRCDCRHIPSAEDMAGDLRTDPRAAFDAGHVTGLSRADAKAIADGADIGQVINARRGMYTTKTFGRTVKATSEGTTRRGVAFASMRDTGTVTQISGSATRLTRRGAEQRLVTQTRARVPRLRPESIYEIAGDDRDEAIRLLQRFGYLT